jgi:hypothetical protein
MVGINKPVMITGGKQWQTEILTSFCKETPGRAVNSMVNGMPAIWTASHYRWLYYITYTRNERTAGRSVLNIGKKETERRKGKKKEE